jgi:transcription elongation factor Elf1
MVTVAIGYSPEPIFYCPGCGSENFSYHGGFGGDGKLACENCGLVCFLVEAETSRYFQKGQGKNGTLNET